MKKLFFLSEIILGILCFSCGNGDEEGNNRGTEIESSAIIVDLTLKTVEDQDPWVIIVEDILLPGYVVIHGAYYGDQTSLAVEILDLEKVEIPGTEVCSNDIIPQYPLFTCDWTFEMARGEQEGVILIFADGKKTKEIKIIFEKEADIVLY